MELICLKQIALCNGLGVRMIPRFYHALKCVYDRPHDGSLIPVANALFIKESIIFLTKMLEKQRKADSKRSMACLHVDWDEDRRVTQKDILEDRKKCGFTFDR